ncbi:MAG: hypothetical protein NTW79_04310, partial [Candidatus Berkelbacteria bacterium]|nr:hypothetical protein [Candidatus Berkelbacteria bacterium]
KKMMFYITILSIQELILYTFSRLFDEINHYQTDILSHHFERELATAPLSKKEAYKIYYGNYHHVYSEVPFAKWLYRLRDSGYINYKHNSESIEFTFKTKLKLMNKIGEKFEESNLYHFISFDIPEELRRTRDSFREAIKDLGYKQVQKSLWVINKDVFEIVESVAYEMKIEKYLVNLISKESDIDGVLDKMFIK